MSALSLRKSKNKPSGYDRAQGHAAAVGATFVKSWRSCWKCMLSDDDDDCNHTVPVSGSVFCERIVEKSTGGHLAFSCTTDREEVR